MLFAQSMFDQISFVSSMLAGTLGLSNSLEANQSQLSIFGLSLTSSQMPATGNGAKKKKQRKTNSKLWETQQLNPFPKDFTKRKCYLTFLSWDRPNSLVCLRLFQREPCIMITSTATKTQISYIFIYIVPRAHHHRSNYLPQQGQKQLLHWNQRVGKGEGMDLLGTASQGIRKLRSYGEVFGQSNDVHSWRDAGCCRKCQTFLGTFWIKNHKICYSHPSWAHLQKIFSICAEEILSQWLWSHWVQSASLVIGWIRQQRQFGQAAWWKLIHSSIWLCFWWSCEGLSEPQRWLHLLRPQGFLWWTKLVTLVKGLRAEMGQDCRHWFRAGRRSLWFIVQIRCSSW